MKHKKLITDPECSKRMGNVSLKGGEIEAILAKSLWSHGVRYRKNYRSLPGSPDIAITKYKIAIFVDGEFWHGYDWINKKSKLKRNKEYWIEKIEENIEHDKKVTKQLEEAKWIVFRFWYTDVKKDVNACMQKILTKIYETNSRA